MDLQEKRVAILLPAYNEELTIASSIRAFHQAMPEALIYVIDNNSSDATSAIAQSEINAIRTNGKSIGGVLSEKRQGKGNAIRRAFMEIDADIYVMADADMTYPAEQIGDLITPILKGQADMVVGDRHTHGAYRRENKRKFHGFGNALVTGLVNKIFRAVLVDIMSGYRAMSRLFVKNYPVLIEGFELETDLTLHALHNRFRIVEIPIAYVDRPEGSFSKLDTLSDGRRVLLSIFNILRHYRPLVFFGVASPIFMAASLLSAIPVMQDWFSERYIHHVPLAILATGLALVSIILFSIGLVLDSVVHLQRFNYELWLLRDSSAPRTGAESSNDE